MQHEFQDHGTRNVIHQVYKDEAGGLVINDGGGICRVIFILVSDAIDVEWLIKDNMIQIAYSILHFISFVHDLITVFLMCM